MTSSTRRALQAKGWGLPSSSVLKELLELHRGAHVALDLQLAGHVRARRVLLAASDPFECLLGRRDRHVAVLGALRHGDAAVLDIDLPFAGAFDVEDVRVVHPGGPRGVDAGLEAVEEVARTHGKDTTSVTGSSPRRSRRDGSSAASAVATIGAPAATNNAVRKLVASARRPSPTAATPPRPTDNPITSPDAVPTCRGMYSWPITIVTPNVPTTHAPTRASAIAPGTPPTSTNTSTSGPVAATLASSTGRRPKRSASGPSSSVPVPPVNSISASRWFPCAVEWPSETSQSGTNVISPNHATLRSAITPSSSFIATGSFSPARACATPACGTNASRYGVVVSKANATAMLGSASRSPPRSPNAATSAVVATGPSAKPRLPPIENHAMPLARLRPLTKPANFEPSGWLAALPTPESSTRRSTSQ